MEKLIPNAVGPYSPFRISQNTIYISGQLGIDPITNTLKENIVEQSKQALKNIENILKLNGYKMSDVLKTTVLIADINDFTKVNEVYATFFTEPYPARSAFSVKSLPKSALVEIEVIAVK